jgi:hypothetical protein
MTAHCHPSREPPSPKTRANLLMRSYARTARNSKGNEIVPFPAANPSVQAFGEFSPCGPAHVSRLGIRRRYPYIDFNFFML